MSAETHRLTAVYKSEFPSCVFVFRNALIIRLFYLCLGSACQQESAGGRQTLRQRMFCCCVCVDVCAWIHSQQAQSVRSMGFLVVWRLQGCVWRSRSEEVCVGWHVGCWQGLCVWVCLCDLTEHIQAVPGQEVEQHGDASRFPQSLCSTSDRHWSSLLPNLVGLLHQAPVCPCLPRQWEAIVH